MEYDKIIQPIVTKDAIIKILMKTEIYKNNPEKAEEHYNKMQNRNKEEYASELAIREKEIFEKNLEERNKDYRDNFFKLNKLPIKNFEDFKTNVYGQEKEKGETIKRTCIGFINKVNDLKKGLYLHSNTRGSGKTLMAYILLNNLLNLNKRIYFTTSTELFFKLTRGISENSGENFKIIEKCKNIEILFLDDFGTEKVSEYVNNVLFNVIDYRLNNDKITIFTSNKTVDETSVDEKIKSRINKMSIDIEFPEQSIRSLEAKIENKKLLELLLED
jgi:DNA replication protein DnaC